MLRIARQTFISPILLSARLRVQWIYDVSGVVKVIMQNLSGHKLGNYELRERLGRGGMAEVYKAYQPSMDRFVAIKVMLGHLATDDSFIKRFKREAQAVGRLRHPHIVQIFDFGIQDDMYYMAMEYVQGGNLKQHIVSEDKLPLDDSLKIAHDLADALAYAHQANMIHRDMKPANVMFVDKATNDIVLTDFGIARIIGATNLTDTGMAVGTPAYMSPEAGQGEDVDERADIYALGIILYEMLTGQVPYDADTPLAVIMKHINAPLPTREQYGDDIPEATEGILLKCMAKDREERFQTAAELRDVLAEALNTASHVANTKPVTTKTPDTQSSSTNATQQQTVLASTDMPTTAVSPSQAKGINPIFVAAMAGVAVIVIAALFLLSQLGADNNPDTDTETIAEDSTLIANITDNPEPTVELETIDDELMWGGELPPNEANLSVLTGISELMDEADRMVLAGDMEGARRYVDGILSDVPENAEALFARSQLYSLSFDTENIAGQAAEQLIDVDPENPYGYIALSDAWMNFPARQEEGAIDQAIAAIETAFELAPENPHIMWRMARLGDWELEVERMNQAEMLGASGYRYIFNMGNFLYNTSNFERAIPYLEVFVRDTEPDASTTNEAFWLMVASLIQVGRADDGLTALASRGVLDNTTNGFLYADAAYVAYRAMDFELAEEWANTALALSDEADEARYLLALLAWWADDDLDAALDGLTALEDAEVFSLFININFQHTIAIDRARILTDAGRYDEALEYYNDSLDVWLYSTWLYEERADLHLLMEDVDAAREDLQTALEVSDVNDEGYRAALRERILELSTDDS